MHALPPDGENAPETSVTGVTCPECAGSLEVRHEGRNSLRFLCRVRHTFSIEELLAGKEEKIESDLWAVVRSLAEFVALLTDLEVHARRVRAVLEENHPVVLRTEG